MPRRLSASAIRSRIRALEDQARRLERNATKGLRAVATVIAKYGLSLSDLKQAISMSKGGRRSSPLAGRSVPAKYRDAQGNTWSGRGRPPLWLVAAEKAGRKRESFLIGKKPRMKAQKAANRKKTAKKATAAKQVAA